MALDVLRVFIPRTRPCETASDLRLACTYEMQAMFYQQEKLSLNG